MRSSNVVRSLVAVSSGYMNATWPPAHYSWVVTSDGFKNDTAQIQFQKESASGHFCHNQSLPHGVERILFPATGGSLQFNSTGGYSDSWTVNVVSDNVLDIGTDASGLARAGKSWIWDDSPMSNGLYCSSGLRLIHQVLLDPANSTSTVENVVPETSLHGLNATLGIEMVQHGPALNPDKNIVTVLRQCTFIQFTSDDQHKDIGPCGVYLSSSVPTRTSFPPNGGSGSGHNNFELWGTFLIVLGVATLLAIVAFLVQRRRRKRAEMTGEAEAPIYVYDAAAARMRQQEGFAPAPDYTTANGGVSLPTYDEATRK